jgi:type IV secretory pathway ATPase VirB11/archaellum biosynthesis ATPase
VADTSPVQGRWAFRPVPPEPRSIVELLRAGTLDAELAATLWLLVEGRVPLIVAADARGVGKSTLLAALLDFLPPGTRLIELSGEDETFDWLPQASELGWHGVARPPEPGVAPVRPDDTVLLAAELSEHTPAYTWGEAARVAVRAASIGYGLAATIHADSLDDVFDALRRPPVASSDDELSRLGVVLILRRMAGDRRRVAAAHYVRPVVRDLHGHVQQLGPAVLATWDPATDTFEHFGWGVTPELALRVGRKAGDFELEVEARRALLETLLARAVTDVAGVRDAIARYHPVTAPTLH